MPKPETPLLTVDALIIYKRDNIVLIRRKNPPFKGQLALPGGFVDIGETVEQACIREAKEETSLDIKIERLLGVFSDPDRDPRGHTVTIAFVCRPKNKQQKPKADTDAAGLEIIELSEVSEKEIAFDHKKIIKSYLKSLKEK
jgi:8-oxo-dGTP diphosphatase